MGKPKSGRHGPTLTEAWLAYVAGYIDGEGSFLFSTTPTVSISNTFPYVLRKLHEVHGGTVENRRATKNCRSYYQWRIYGDDAIEMIRLIYPYLWEKLPQADLLLRIRDTKPGPKRDGLIAQLKHLKHLEYE